MCQKHKWCSIFFKKDVEFLLKGLLQQKKNNQKSCLSMGKPPKRTESVEEKRSQLQKQNQT
jgi:hypothetical protein